MQDPFISSDSSVTSANAKDSFDSQANETISDVETNSLLEKNKDDDDEKLGKDHPFKTILKLSAGPFIFFTANRFHDATDLYFVKKAYNGTSEDMVGIVSLAAVIRSLVEGIATFYAPALAFKTAELVAKNNNDQAAQLLVDFIRIGVVIAILVPLILNFSLPSLLNLLGAPNEMRGDITNYIFYTSLCSIFLSVFKCCGQVLNGLGKTFVQSMLEMGAISISLFIGDPIMMFGFKAGSSFLGANYYSGTVLISTALAIAFFTGKFAVKPTLRMLISKPSSEFTSSLKTIAPFFAMLIFGIIGPLVTLGNIVRAANNSKEEYRDYISTAISSITKPLGILEAMVNGLTEGIKSSGTWAFNHGKLNRLKQLMFYTLVAPMIIVTIVSPMMIAKPTLIMSIWISNKEMLDAIKVLAPIIFYATWVLPISDLISFMLIITGYPLRVFVLQFIFCVSHVSVSSLLYMNHRADPSIVALVYPITFGIFGLCSIIMFVKPYIKHLYKKSDEDNDINRTLL